MSDKALAVVVLAAGQGTRMKSALPKVMHAIGGRPMLAHVLSVAKSLEPDLIVTVTAAGAEAVASLGREWGECVEQERQLGTGHAVLAAEGTLEAFAGNLLVLFGDAPLLTSETLRRLVARLAEGADIAALGFRAVDPSGYGRMIATGDRLDRIVEHKDASAAERDVKLCFAGMLAGKARLLFDLLHKIDNRNAQGEFYLTDVIALARTEGRNCAAVEGPEHEMLGVNSRAQLAEAESRYQARRRNELMDAGVSFVAPETVILSADTIIEADATIGPYVVFGPGVTVRRGSEIRAFCHIENSMIGSGASVGPFARLRGGAVLEERVHIGNFVELKNVRLEEGVKASHLTYLGDAHVGTATNVGAGTITCNYDGAAKNVTDIGARVFVGSNATLVAPLKVGDGAYIAAGSVITEEVKPDDLVLGRARQVAKPGRAEQIRARNKSRSAKGS